MLEYSMILIRFPSEDAKDRALELLLGEYAFSKRFPVTFGGFSCLSMWKA
jgi:hypothetical protein